MRRWLYTTVTVHGDPSTLEELLRRDVSDLLAGALGGRVDGIAADGSQTLRLPSRLLGIDAEKAVRVRTGVASRPGNRTVIPLTWEPEHARVVFPSFEGSLELAAHDRGLAELTLVGSYRIPLGPLGAAAEAIALRAVAERTAEQLLNGVAAELATVAREPAAPVVVDAGPGAPLTVRDVMTDDPLVILDDLPVRTAALLLFHLGVSGAPVVTQDGALIGVLSERDLLEKEAVPAVGLGRKGADVQRRRDALTVGEACTRPAVTTVPDVPLREAVRTMVERDISRLVVIEGSRVAGIITRHDVLQALLRTDAELRRSVEALLRGRDEPEVRTTVQWGVVHVAGQVQLRSQVQPVLEAIRAVDGVIAVEGDLGFVEDDVLPILVGGPHL